MFSATAHQTHGEETANTLDQRAKESVSFGRQSLSKAISVMREEGCDVNHVSTQSYKTHIAASGASVPSAKIRQLQAAWVSVQVLVEGVNAADITARRQARRHAIRDAGGNRGKFNTMEGKVESKVAKSSVAGTRTGAEQKVVHMDGRVHDPKAKRIKLPPEATTACKLAGTLSTVTLGAVVHTVVVDPATSPAFFAATRGSRCKEVQLDQARLQQDATFRLLLANMPASALRVFLRTRGLPRFSSLHNVVDLRGRVQRYLDLAVPPVAAATAAAAAPATATAAVGSAPPQLALPPHQQTATSDHMNDDADEDEDEEVSHEDMDQDHDHVINSADSEDADEEEEEQEQEEEEEGELEEDEDDGEEQDQEEEQEDEEDVSMLIEQ
jgi:hypothetical protein